MQEVCGKITKLRNIDSKTANEQGFFFRMNGQNCKIMSYKGDAVKIRIPDMINGKPVRVIGKRAFARKNISSVVLPNGLRKISEEAFYQCKFKEVELPEQIEKIEKNAFGECENLTTVTLKGRNKELDTDWYGFAKTPFVDSPDLVILGSMLLRINAVDEEERILKIPHDVTVVGRHAADNGTYRYDLQYEVIKIEIPASVKKVEDEAFRKLWRCEEVEVEHTKRRCSLHLGRNVFGTVYRGNYFIKRILRQQRFRIYWARGIQIFHHLSLVYYENGYPTQLGTYAIYIPTSEKDREAFWECMQIKYGLDNQFYLSFSLEEYYQLMIQVVSSREQLQMAKFLLAHSYAHWREKIVLFFQEHINKAVEYAIKENDVEQMKIYASFHLLEQEKGFRVRHGKYLIERYQNEASELLQKHFYRTNA